MAQGSVQLSKHNNNKTELGVEASSKEKGPLEGKPKKMISALTSWEGKGWRQRMHFLLRHEISYKGGQENKWSKAIPK